MSFVGTHLEYLEVTRRYGDEVYKSIDMALSFPILKGDRSVISVVSVDTGEVFFDAERGISWR